MRVPRPLSLTFAVALLSLVYSCRPAEEPQSGPDAYWSKPDAPTWGKRPERKLPIWMHDDGSVKDGYDIIDVRDQSPQRCNVHGFPMREELQEHKYMLFDQSVRGLTRFTEARAEHFPHARESVRSPLTRDWQRVPGQLLVRYCPQCRAEQHAWIRKIWPYWE